MLLKIWLNVFSTEKGATCPRDRLNRTARVTMTVTADPGDEGGTAARGPRGAAGASVLCRLPAGAEAEPGRGPRPGIAPREPPASPGGLGVNGGVRLAAEGTRGVGYGAI